jgi:squalene synthase HpnC
MARFEGPTDRTVTSLVAPPVPDGMPGLEAVDQQRAAENFPVALRMLPSAVRDDLIAIYGFARLVDDIGDEMAGDRLAALDWLEQDLQACADGAAVHPILRRLTATIRAHRLPLEPFRDLIEANRRDQVQTRYANYADLLDYCRYSANPVGRVVLAVFGVEDHQTQRLSDDVCTALQVIEHVQDVAEDLRADRVYLPQQDLQHFGCTESDLASRSASPALRHLVAFECTRAADLLASGSELTARLRGWPKLAIAGFVAGGHAALGSIRRARYDVLAHECTPRSVDVAFHLVKLLTRRSRP